MITIMTVVTDIFIQKTLNLLYVASAEIQSKYFHTDTVNFRFCCTIYCTPVIVEVFYEFGFAGSSFNSFVISSVRFFVSLFASQNL